MRTAVFRSLREAHDGFAQWFTPVQAAPLMSRFQPAVLSAFTTPHGLIKRLLLTDELATASLTVGDTAPWNVSSPDTDAGMRSQVV
jgi:hypothetical protein